LDIFYLVYK